MDPSPHHAITILMILLAGTSIGGAVWWFIIREDIRPSIWHFIGMAAAMIIGGLLVGYMMAVFWLIVLFMVAIAAVIFVLGFGLKSAHQAWRDHHRHSR